ncbi:MAG: acyl carrier protein [Lachnospiraceae bacterium]|nr:acyl carrier protein [Lachnospiraceae bacterium]MBQ6196426.1 acyl carrier protein [Lachnospiraceae bacterium]
MDIEKIRDIIATTLNLDPEEVTPEKSFAEDLDADSLDLAEIIMAIEDEFGVTIADELLEKVVTVQDAYDLVKTIG